VFDWPSFYDEAGERGPALLAGGGVPEPPEGPFAAGRAYPLAVDVDGAHGAVSFAALDAYPDIEPGWWCVAIRFSLIDGVWHEGGQDDNSTTQRPFERPTEVTNSTESWCDWHSNGGLAGFEEGEPDRHMFFGVAPTGTARLTVTDATGRERDLAITPWCGAYVADVTGDFSRLTGYGAGGETLGSFERPTDPDVEPPPGWEGVGEG
jgi:hypothetical protein